MPHSNLGRRGEQRTEVRVALQDDRQRRVGPSVKYVGGATQPRAERFREAFDEAGKQAYELVPCPLMLERDL